MGAHTIYLFDWREQTVWVEAPFGFFVNITQNELMFVRLQIFIYSHMTFLCSHLDLFSGLQIWSTPLL